MIWFLRRFEAFRSLESRLELTTHSLDETNKRLHEAQAGSRRAEQEVEHLRKMITDLRADIKQSQAEALQAVKVVANEKWQSKYGTVLYSDVPSIPEARVPFSESGSVAPGKTSVRLEQERKMSQFQREAEEQWDMAHKRR